MPVSSARHDGVGGQRGRPPASRAHDKRKANRRASELARCHGGGGRTRLRPAVGTWDGRRAQAWCCVVLCSDCSVEAGDGRARGVRACASPEQVAEQRLLSSRA